MQNIRNFSIIAHIDHGKSTLADRMLEVTGTVEKRRMREQVLDSMELERERGITIKMQPVRMEYCLENTKHRDQNTNKAQNTDLESTKSLGSGSCALGSSDSKFILNLIDTPGHIDFSYEVSRALRAVEGSLLLVDATQGVQAQTLTTLGMAREAGLVIIPVLSKIDSPLARIDEVRNEVCKLLSCEVEEVMLVSGKTGEGVKELLEQIVERIPSPEVSSKKSSDVPSEAWPDFSPESSGSGVFRSLVFDFHYSNHRGVVVFVRVFSGSVKKGDKLVFKTAKKSFQSLETGIFAPDEKETSSLSEGEIGYIVTGIKEPGIASVGDTVAAHNDSQGPLLGYEKAKPVVWASIYPENQDFFVALKQALSRLQLSDSAFSFEEESSGVLGRGFRCGFLGMLHLEIITERLKREFDIPLIITLPSITYRVTYKTNKTETIYTPSLFPESHLIQSVEEPWVKATIITPPEYIGSILTLLYEHEAEIQNTENFGDARTAVSFEMPLRELMRGFFDRLKGVTSGFGSISYEISGERQADVVRLDILVADEPVPAFAKVISRRQVEQEAEVAVDKLKSALPRQMFSFKIQAQALGRIISSRSMSGMKKDVTQHMYGGDITRKMKLREKQKKGKKKMQARGKVNIPQDVFLKMMRND